MSAGGQSGGSTGGAAIGRASTGFSSTSNVGGAPGSYLSRESADSRRSEQAKLDDLSGRYGVDTTQRDARVPQALRTAATVLHDTAGVSSAAGGGGWRVGDSASSRSGKTLAGRELVSQLILAHLDSSRVTAPQSDTLRKEMKSFGLDEAYFVANLSPLAFHATSHVVLPLSTVRSGPANTGPGAGSSAAGAAAAAAAFDGAEGSSSVSLSASLLDDLPRSPLYLLMNAQPTARLVVQQLLSHTYDVLSQQAAVPRNEFVLRRLADSCEQPMWSEPDAEALLLQRHPTSGRIIVATVNQLVEELTAVHINPVAAQPAHEQQVNDVFVHSFLAIYRCFLTPHALLAKLIQRYFVPLSFRIGDLHHSRGVLYKSHGESVHSSAGAPRASVNGQLYGKRTAVWLKVQQQIRLRVLCVLGEWLRAHPNHFDAQMLQSIMLFVEENCSRPAPHADCPSRILQASEFIKCRVALLLTSGVDAFAASFDPRLPPTLSDTDPSHVPHPSCFQPPTILLQALSVFQQGSLVSATSGLLSGLALRSGTVRFGPEAAAPATERQAAVGRLSSLGGTPTSLLAPTLPPAEGAWLDSARRTAAAALVAELVALDPTAVATHLRACSNVLFRYVRTESLVELALSRASLPQSFRVHHHLHGGALAALHHHSGSDESISNALNQFGSWAEHERAVPFFAHALRLMCWCTSSILYAAVIDATASASSRPSANDEEETAKYSAGASTSASTRSSAATSSSSAAPRRKLATTEAVILFFLDLTTKMIELNDMHSAFAIVSGMQHPAVARLHVPLFQPHLLFYDRIRALFELFDLESGQYAEHVASLPESETHALIPLLHDPLEEMRNLDAAYPTLYACPSAATAETRGGGSGGSLADDPLMIGGGGSGTATSSTLPAHFGPSRSSVLVHWRKLQAIASIAEEIATLQDKPMHHELIGSLRMVYDDDNNMLSIHAATSMGRSGGGGSGATVSSVAAVARAGYALESSQFPNMTVNPQDLVALSLTVLP